MAIAIAAASLYAVLAFTHPLPFSDQWDLTARFLGKTDAGSLLAALWQPHNEHRLVTFNLINAADYAVFGSSNVFNRAVLVAAMAGSAALLLALLHRAGMSMRALQRWAAPLAIAGVFTGVQSENLTWALGLQWHLTQLFVLGALLPLATGTAGPLAVPAHFAAVVVCSILASLSSANGLLVWPLTALLCWASGERVKLIAMYLLIGAGFGALWAGGMPGNERASLLLAALVAPRDIVAYVARFAGSLWYWADAPLQGFGFALATGYLIVVASLGLAIALLARRPVLTPQGRVLAIILLFAIGTGCLAAIGRIGFSPDQAFAPRYTSTGGLLWAAVLIAIVALPLPPRWSRMRILPVARWAVALWALGALLIYQPRALAIVAEWHAERERASLALAVGVPDDAILRRVYPDSARVLALAENLRARQRSVFASAPASYMGVSIRDFAPAPATACPGVAERLEDLRLVADGRLVGMRAHGWAWDRSADAPLQTLLIANEQGVVIGLGQSGLRRPDLTGARSEHAGWTAHVQPFAGTLTAYGITRAGQLCELAGRS